MWHCGLYHHPGMPYSLIFSMRLRLLRAVHWLGAREAADPWAETCRRRSRKRL